MSSKRKLSLYSQLPLEDVICPICLSILLEPVTMPCAHSLCMPCFKQHVAETSLQCPVCRMRISVWVRRSTKSNRLVNNRLWQAIKEKFPERIEARLQGLDDLDDEELLIPEPRVCAQGEIRQEYEALIQKEEQELASRRSQEEEASTKLIMKLQEEEKMRLRQRRAQEEQLYQEDEILALQLKKEERAKLKHPVKTVSTPPRGPMDMYLGQKTPSSKGKLLLPDTVPHSSKMSSMSYSSSKPSGNYAMSPKSALETLSTPSSSCTAYSTHSGKHTFGGFSRNNSANSNDSTDSLCGRSLREITSSQSSESESEDMSNAAKIKKNKHVATSGKENVEDFENESPHKLDKPVKTRSSIPKKMDRNKKMSKLLKLECIDSEMETMEQMITLPKENEMDEDDPDTEVEKKKKVSSVPRKKISNEERSHNSKTSVTEVKKSSKLKDDNPSENEVDEDNNISLDYSLLFSGEALDTNIEKLKAEQLKIEERLKQEEQDRLYAEYLQMQFNQNPGQVDRSRGSGDEYALRTRKSATGSKMSSKLTKTSTPKRERQTTLIEAMAKRQKKS
ncbi:E3 ubiquitin-protein ligase rnf168-like isoform X2 [Palaemon carinicauda]|uniref:E3 ubiquitin-protein ligase rnf168-like isoform X2 n=1 Tax=Palaemon carinicauda TaxID=392227 RepID=UPI0035B629C1